MQMTDISSKPKLAIVIPVFNVESYIRECLDSVRSQTYKNFVVFAVDDGSNDRSGVILDDYSKMDGRFFVIHKKNGGVSSARNAALDVIERDGSFDGICFIDSDDYVKPDFLSTFVSLSLEHNADYVVSAWETFDRLGSSHIARNKILAHSLKIINKQEAYEQFLGSGQWKNKSKSCSLFCSNRYFSKLIVQGLRFDLNLKNAEDQDFIMRALIRVKRGVVTSAVTYMYRLRLSSISHSNSDRMYDMLFASRLLDNFNYFPTAGMRSIEYLACKYWWACVRQSIYDGTFSKKRVAIHKVYEIIRSHRFHDSSIFYSYRKRMFIYSLGELALRIYLCIKNKNHKNDLENAFP